MEEKTKRKYVKPGKTARRALIDTYTLMTERYTRLNLVSLRKKLCLLYVKWGAFADKEAKFEFVELSKVWRTEENKIGMPRTKLERIARKLYQWARKRKSVEKHIDLKKEASAKAVQSKKGIHSEDKEKARELKRKGGLEARRRQREGQTECGGYWIVISPEGKVFHIRNLRKFCREWNLDNRHLGTTARRPNIHHKGWRAQKWDPDWVDVANKVDEV